MSFPGFIPFPSFRWEWALVNKVCFGVSVANVKHPYIKLVVSQEASHKAGDFFPFEKAVPQVTVGANVLVWQSLAMKSADGFRMIWDDRLEREKRQSIFIAMKC